MKTTQNVSNTKSTSSQIAAFGVAGLLMAGTAFAEIPAGTRGDGGAGSGSMMLSSSIVDGEPQREYDLFVTIDDAVVECRDNRGALVFDVFQGSMRSRLILSSVAFDKTVLFGMGEVARPEDTATLIFGSMFSESAGSLVRGSADVVGGTFTRTGLEWMVAVGLEDVIFEHYSGSPIRCPNASMLLTFIAIPDPGDAVEEQTDADDWKILAASFTVDS